jgi:hypothetical protein
LSARIPKRTGGLSSNFTCRPVGKAMKALEIIKAVQFLDGTDWSFGLIFWPYGMTLRSSAPRAMA